MSKLVPFVLVSIFASVGYSEQSTSTVLKGSGVESGINSSGQKFAGSLRGQKKNLGLSLSLPLAGQTDEQISEYVREVFQDSDGVYWFGTNGDGVGRYDGESLTFLSLDEGFGGQAVRGILQAPDGELWFATNGGVSRYKSGKFTNYTSANGLTDDQVWSIFQDSAGTIWVGTMGGVCRFDGTSFVPFPIPRAKVENPADGFGPQVVWSMFEDRDGNMWFGTDGEGARKYDGESFTIYTNKEGLAGNTVRSIVGDNQGRIWFGTRSGGVSRFDGTDFRNFTKADGLTNDEVYEILEDSTGNIWFSTLGEGICRYDGTTFTAFGAESGLILPHVQSIFEDRSGILWLGCSGGLFRYDGKAFVNVKKDGPWPTGTPSAAETEESKDDQAALSLDGLKQRSVYATLDKAAIEAIAAAAQKRWAQELSGFTFGGVERCTAGGVTHWMSTWRHIKTGLEFALVPGGTFQMGSPASEASRKQDELQHSVTLDPFLMARTECTQGAWTRLASIAGFERAPSHFKGSDLLPVESVSLQDIAAWCNSAELSLPTEAQWEFACRGGTMSAWATGADKSDLSRLANLGSADCPQDWIDHEMNITEPWLDGFGDATAPAESFNCNSFGLFDVHGNVREWCRDHYYSYEVRPEDGTGFRPGVSKFHVARGGSFNASARFARSAVRLKDSGAIHRHHGFRPSLDLPF